MTDIDSLLLPEINLETDDIIMNIAVRKDYSEIKDIDERKRVFINDLKWLNLIKDKSFNLLALVLLIYLNQISKKGE